MPSRPEARGAPPKLARVHAFFDRSPRHSDAGTSPIELAILLPTIIAAVFASIQVAVVYLAEAEALAAAQQAVTAQRAYQALAGVGALRADEFLRGGAGGVWLSAWTISVDDTSVPTEVTVTVSGNAPALLWNIRVSETVHGTVERPTGAADPADPANPEPTS